MDFSLLINKTVVSLKKYVVKQSHFTEKAVKSLTNQLKNLR